MLRVQLLQGYSLQHKLFVLCHRGVWFTGYQLANSSFVLYPEDVWRCLYHLLEYLNQKIRRKREVGNPQCLLFVVSAAFLSCSLQVVAHSFFSPPFILVVVNSFKNGFSLAEPSPTRNSNFPVPFPPTILPQQVDAGAIKNEGCVS